MKLEVLHIAGMWFVRYGALRFAGYDYLGGLGEIAPENNLYTNRIAPRVHVPRFAKEGVDLGSEQGATRVMEWILIRYPAFPSGKRSDTQMRHPPVLSAMQLLACREVEDEGANA